MTAPHYTNLPAGALAVFFGGGAFFLVVFRFAFRFVPFRDPVFVRFILSDARSSSHVSGSSSGFPPRASIHASHVARHREGSNPCSPRYSSSCTRLHVWRFKRYPSTARSNGSLFFIMTCTGARREWALQ